MKEISQIVHAAVGVILPNRPRIAVPDWPAALCTPGAHLIRELFERYWPIRGVGAYHSLWSLRNCLSGDDLSLLHPFGRTAIASGWGGDVICVSIDPRLEVSIANHEVLWSDGARSGEVDVAELFCPLCLDLGEYLEKLARIEATVRFDGGSLRYDFLSVEDDIPGDFGDAVKSWTARGH